MSPRLRLAIPVFLAVAVLVAGLALGGAFDGSGRPPGLGGSSTPPGGAGVAPTLAPSPTPRPPLGGTELFGYVPYWELHESTAAYLRDVPLTTIGLFSVSARRSGAINDRPLGHQRITGPIGRQIIAEAHKRDVRVELVFSSFGSEKNAVFFGRVLPGPPAPAEPGASPGAIPSAGNPPSPVLRPTPWVRAVDELVALALELDVDGINVDVERLDPLDRETYGTFLSTLRSKLVAKIPHAQVSVATEAGFTGVDNAAFAAAAGVDRIFLMGYDYHWSGSQPGASSPVDRSDGLYTLRWSIDRYVEAGVPRDRILLGLPLYGMTWQTIGPDRGFHVVRKGQSFIPRQNLDLLLDDSFAPLRDSLEVAEYFLLPEIDAWSITYYDSPATLRVKLALARDAGLAGGGFWAIGYERGVPGYLRLMTEFRDGKVGRSEAPAVPSPGAESPAPGSPAAGSPVGGLLAPMSPAPGSPAPESPAE